MYNVSDHAVRNNENPSTNTAASFPILLSNLIQLDLINLTVKSSVTSKTPLKLGSGNY